MKRKRVDSKTMPRWSGGSHQQPTGTQDRGGRIYTARKAAPANRVGPSPVGAGGAEASGNINRRGVLD